MHEPKPEWALNRIAWPVDTSKTYVTATRRKIQRGLLGFRCATGASGCQCRESPGVPQSHNRGMLHSPNRPWSPVPLCDPSADFGRRFRAMGSSREPAPIAIEEKPGNPPVHDCANQPEPGSKHTPATRCQKRFPEMTGIFRWHGACCLVHQSIHKITGDSHDPSQPLQKTSFHVQPGSIGLVPGATRPHR